MIRLEHADDSREGSNEDKSLLAGDLAQHTALAAQAGISRQQLINSPCPICGDKISGFHYGIFSCESCKGSSSSISLNDTCILVQKRVSPSNIEPSGCLKWPNRFPSR